MTPKMQARMCSPICRGTLGLAFKYDTGDVCGDAFGSKVTSRVFIAEALARNSSCTETKSVIADP
jgi:hypothetical protein